MKDGIVKEVIVVYGPDMTGKATLYPSDLTKEGIAAALFKEVGMECVVGDNICCRVVGILDIGKLH